MNSVLQSLKQQLRQINELIIDKNDVLYFDYPLHLNVGDLLIYAGTEQFFKDYQIQIRLRRCLQAFDITEVKKYIQPNTTLLCHGGGNFGSLYPSIQKMREDLVAHFPHNRVIVLPQTAHFANNEDMQKSAQIFVRHQDCHLFARDSKTFDLMQNFSDKVYLSPDMAHQLYSILPQKQAVEAKSAVKILYFLRKDIEASSIEKQIQNTLPNLDNVKDWEDILRPEDVKFELLCSRLSRVANKFKMAWLKNWVNKHWYAHALAVIERSRQIFISYDEVTTSRLHGHIFSCLLGIPNQVCDNSYGKNSAYFNQWTKGVEYSKLYEQQS